MARPKETDEQKVKKVYPDARLMEFKYFEIGGINEAYGYKILDNYVCISSELQDTPDLAWSDALTKIRKAKIKAAKDKRKQAQPVTVKEIKKHVSLTMYPSDRLYITERFKSVQKFLDFSIEQVKIANNEVEKN